MSASFNDLDHVLSPISDRLAEARVCIQPKELPQLIFHYTDAKGILGIIESTRIWATNYRYLNDSSEINYGVALFDSVVESRLKNVESEVVAEFLRRTRATANAFDGMFDCYVACFCERDDLLNQWRVYAGSGGGFALGFHARQIGMRIQTATTPQHDFFLRKVLYDEAKQRELISELIESTISALIGGSVGMSPDEANNLIARCCQFVRNEAAEFFIAFKHPAFEVEQEWRLCQVVAGHENPDLQFRDGPYGLTPFVKLDPSPSAGVFTNKLPLAQITHGPCSDPTNVRYALDKMLRLHDYAHTNITGSTLPVRIGP